MNNYKTRCVSFLLIYPVFPNLIGCFPSRKSLQQSAKVRIIEIETCLSTLLHAIFKSSDSLEDLHPCNLPLTHLINMTTTCSQRQVTTFDPLTIDPQCPHVNRGDVNCDGINNVQDVVYLIDYVFRGGIEPCDPCLCFSYPSSCP